MTWDSDRKENAMDRMLVVAIIRSSSLEAAEKGLQQIGVRDITVTKVRTYAEHVDFLSRDHLVEQVKIEVFAAQDRATLPGPTRDCSEHLSYSDCSRDSVQNE